MTDAPFPRWQRSLERALRSVESEAQRTSRTWALYVECSACANNSQLLAFRDSWPHWLRHELSDALSDIRSVEFLRVLAVDFDGETTLGDRYRNGHDGSGRARTRSAESAIRIVDTHMASFDRWICDQLATLPAWARCVTALVYDDGEAASLTELVTRWIDRLPQWTPANETEVDRCGLCMGFFMVDAAGLPGWTPHSLTHSLAREVNTLMRRFGYNWANGTLGERPRKRPTLRFEESFFHEMRTLSRGVQGALNELVLPRLPASENLDI